MKFLMTVIVGFLVLAFLGGVALDLLADQSAAADPGSEVQGAYNDTITSITNITGKLPTIGTVIAAVAILGAVFMLVGKNKGWF